MSARTIALYTFAWLAIYVPGETICRIAMACRPALLPAGFLMNAFDAATGVR